jgi:hypothetical protein
MVTVPVGKTPPEEFDQAAQRAYDHIPKYSIEKARTMTELINTIDDMYFKGRGVPNFLTSVGHSFERKGFWKQEEVHVAFPEITEDMLMPEEAPKEVKIEVTKYIKPKKAKKVRTRIAPVTYDEEFAVSYVNNRPSIAKKGQIYKVTKRGRSIKRALYVKRMKNLMKGWYRKRQGIS